MYIRNLSQADWFYGIQKEPMKFDKCPAGWKKEDTGSGFRCIQPFHSEGSLPGSISHELDPMLFPQGETGYVDSLARELGIDPKIIYLGGVAAALFFVLIPVIAIIKRRKTD